MLAAVFSCPDDTAQGGDETSGDGEETPAGDVACGANGMNDLIEMRRVLWGHSWDAPDDWAAAIRRLAELTDEEIGRLPGADEPQARPKTRPTGAQPRACRPRR